MSGLKVNEYFDGNVKSIAFENGEGRATSGVMAVGEYQFDTADHERVKVISGCLHVKLPGADSEVACAAGSEFEVPAGVTFGVRVEEPSAYLCFYT